MREHRPQPVESGGGHARPERRDAALQAGADEVAAQRQAVVVAPGQRRCPPLEMEDTRAARERLWLRDGFPDGFRGPISPTAA